MLRSKSHGRCAVACFVLFVSLLATRSVYCQRLEAQAIPGQPFGVAAVSIPVGQGTGSEDTDLFVEEKNGRVLYPVFAGGRLGRLLGNLVDINPVPGARTVLFLFKGTEPFELTIHTATPLTIELRPQPAPARVQDRLLLRWWREYYASSTQLANSGAFPPVVQTYLTGMLEQRVGLRPPLLARTAPPSKSQLQSTMELLTGTEQLQIDMIKEVMSGARVYEPADRTVPDDIAWPSLEVEAESGTAVEPIARHVPKECYYVRFGNFENYIWLEGLLSSRGGDTSRMVAARGQDAELGGRIRRQLAMPFTVLTKVVGPHLIDDMALIGRDVYLHEGAASGVLLQAHNTGALEASLKQQRLAAMNAEKQWGAKIEMVSIAGHDVSLLSTPDNQLRSFYAIDGDFHLVTSSRNIVERFFAAGQGEGALADTSEFRHARTVMSLDRNDTIFAFTSTSFFQGLMSPQYQIEMRRRLQAITDLQVLQLARLAAKAERADAESVADLIAAGFLPPGFGSSADGSKFTRDGGRTVDSLRGARGSFMPIPDVELKKATAAEVAHCSAIAERAAGEWRQLDPLMVAVNRTLTPGGKLERLTVEANISPLAEEKYGWLMSLVGPPVTQRIVPHEGDIISVQAFVAGGDVAPQYPPHLLYLGIQDTRPQLELGQGGPLQILGMLQATPGYIAAWPKPGFLDWLPLGSNQPAPDGFSQLPFGLWRWQGDDFSALSFHRDILEKTIPHLKVEQSGSPAQLRIHVGDLSQSQLRGWVNSLYYQRARQGSVANVQLLHALAQQLQISPESAREWTELLLDTQLACPLGGTYQLVKSSEQRSVWRSTAWDTALDGNVPPGYVAPLLQWFRGLDVNVTKTGDQVSMQATIDMVPGTESSVLPLLDLFKKPNE